MSYTVDPHIFENYWTNLLDELCTAVIGVLLYGIFVVLFLLAIHLLYHRKTAGRSALLALTVAMGILATVQCSLHVVTAALALRMLQIALESGQQAIPLNPAESLTSIERWWWVLVLTQDLVLVANTVLTDGLLIYRCYLVWGRPPKVFVVLPVLFMLGTLGTGFVTAYDQDYTDGNSPHLDARIVFSLNLCTNFVLMALTAGRIWWITREQRAVFGPHFKPQYNAAIAIILESGAIYCCGLIFQVIGLTVQSLVQIPVYLSHGAIGQLVNIVPTLIVVRVGLGHAVPSANPANTTTTDIATYASGAASRLPNIPQPLRFAVSEASEGDVECAVSEADVRLE
ncbi:hypothetical protein C8R43DRAFT_271081 [Mycena crocata]|nr:hypothetical protein C8R43DRAFT_271081 [Mycena crocata]